MKQVRKCTCFFCGHSRLSYSGDFMFRKSRLNKLGLLLLPFALNACADAFCQDATPAKATFATKENAADVGVNTEKLSKATDALQALVDNKNIAGGVMMVSRRGKVVLAEAVGTGRVDSNQPMQLDSIFRIYSMSKAVTSVAAMQLVEENKLELDAPISKYLPEFASVRVFDDSVGKDTASQPPQIPTVRDLLRHTSGLTYGIFGDTPVDKKYRSAGVLSRNDSNQVLVEKLGKLPLLYQPSTRFLYSVSVDVLGRLVEVVSGNSLDTQFANRIFKPLGMTDSGFYVPEDKASRFVDNFGPKQGGGLRTIEFATTSQFLRNPAFLSGGGGLVSTAGDYMRFCQMLSGLGSLAGVQVLKEETVREMTRNQLPKSVFPIVMNGIPRAGVGFGLGFSVVVERIPGFEYVPQGEYGWGGAASTHFWISPKDELAVVVLTQLMPFTYQSESAVKPLIYEAIENR
jgi:CubicO group peptidase (beta-lactamase class C family)